MSAGPESGFQGEDADDANQRFDSNRFRNVKVEAGPQCVRPVFGLGVAAQTRRGRHSAPFRGQRSHRGDEPVTILARHLQIAEENVRSPCLEDRQRVLGSTSRGHRRCAHLKRELQGIAKIRVVVHDQDIDRRECLVHGLCIEALQEGLTHRGDDIGDAIGLTKDDLDDARRSNRGFERRLVRGCEHPRGRPE